MAATASNLQPADEEFAFIDHFLGEMVVELDEELFVFDDFVAPRFVLKVLQSVEFFFWEIETFPFLVLVVGHPANGSFTALGADTSAIDYQDMEWKGLDFPEEKFNALQ